MHKQRMTVMFKLKVADSKLLRDMATAISILVGSPTIANSIPSIFFNANSIPLLPLISSSAEATKIMLYFMSFRS